MRRIVTAALLCLAVAILIVTLLGGFASSFPLRLLQAAALAVAVIGVLGWVFVSIGLRLADWKEPEDEEEFDRTVERAEELGRRGLIAEPEEEEHEAASDPFAELVREALDDLPAEFVEALEDVPVVVSDGGREMGAYGLYQGDTVARNAYPDRIVIYRDTLLRDFGWDVELLRAQVQRTVRHEIAHHLGWDERGVRGLGL
jgi:predicted Zn-dependent protease with MMP-like domain